MKDDIADFTKKIKTKKILQIKQNIQRLTKNQTFQPSSKNIKQTSTRGLSKDLINNYSIPNRGKKNDENRSQNHLVL